MPPPRNGFAMEKFRRIVYPDGNVYEVTNAHRMRESLANLSRAPVPGFEYPLRIFQSGSSQWGEGVRIERRRCNKVIIEIVTAGEIHYVQAGREYLLKPGMLFLQRPGCNIIYESGPCGHAHKRFVELGGSALSGILAHTALMQCDVCACADPRRFCRLVKEAVRLMRDKAPGYDGRLSALAYEIILIAAESYSQSRYPNSFAAVVAFMDRNLFHQVGIRQLASVAGMSVSSFHRKFAATMSETPLRFFQRLKMEHAADLVRHSDLSIREIALQYGYEDQAYFCNVFKKTIGSPPMALRATSPRKPA
jgi:AraC-like DNA-binding protein